MSSLQNKLYNYEQTPPQNAWDKIAAALDQNGFASKLYNYEQAPPEKIWKNIVDALDESHIQEGFPSRLYNAEAVPPVSAWEKVAIALDAERPAVIQMPKKNFPALRYVAAALVIGFVAFVVIKFAGKNNSGSDNQNDMASQKPDTSSGPADYNTHINASEETPSVTRADENPGSVAATGGSRGGMIKKVRARYSVSDNIDPTEPIYAYNDYFEHTPDLADRYIMLMTPNGIIRVSKKWGNLVCCVSGQDQDEDCKDQIKKWQEKLAASPATSTGNFFDILSLVSSLDSEL